MKNESSFQRQHVSFCHLLTGWIYWWTCCFFGWLFNLHYLKFIHKKIWPPKNAISRNPWGLPPLRSSFALPSVPRRQPENRKFLGNIDGCCSSVTGVDVSMFQTADSTQKHRFVENMPLSGTGLLDVRRFGTTWNSHSFWEQKQVTGNVRSKKIASLLGKYLSPIYSSP